MNWRERFAEWITGGAISRAFNNGWAAGHRTGTRAARQGLLTDQRIIADLQDQLAAQRMDFEEILTEIAAQETPGANSTVRRMASIAREALK